jgi:hypothetical protein
MLKRGEERDSIKLREGEEERKRGREKERGKLSFFKERAYTHSPSHTDTITVIQRDSLQIH